RGARAQPRAARQLPRAGGGVRATRRRRLAPGGAGRLGERWTRGARAGPRAGVGAGRARARGRGEAAGRRRRRVPAGPRRPVTAAAAAAHALEAVTQVERALGVGGAVAAVAGAVVAQLEV